MIKLPFDTNRKKWQFNIQWCVSTHSLTGICVTFQLQTTKLQPSFHSLRYNQLYAFDSSLYKHRNPRETKTTLREAIFRKRCNCWISNTQFVQEKYEASFTEKTKLYYLKCTPYKTNTETKAKFIPSPKKKG